MRRYIRAAALLTAIVVTLTMAVPAQAVFGNVKTMFGHIYGGDGGDANNAFLDTPQGFAADSSCNLYVADTGNFVVRKIATNNVITTYAGSNQYGLKNSTLAASQFKSPTDIVLGPSGEFYVSDGNNNAVRKLDSTSVSTWLTGLKSPQGVTTDGTSLFIADTGHNRILKVNLTTKATSTLVTLSSPGKMAILNGTLYVVNSGYTKLSAVTISTGTTVDLKTGMQDAEGVTVYNGQVYFMSGTNGTVNFLWQYDPVGATFTQLQAVLETEWYNHGSDLLFCGGKLYLLFKSGSSVYTADLDGANPVKIAGAHRWNDRNGSLSSALTGRPTAMALSPDKKKLYVLENEKFKVVDLKTKILSFLAGYANDNYVDGVGILARISGAQQMVMSPKGSVIYFADRNNNRIRQLNLKTNAVTTITGAGTFNVFSGTNNGYAEGGPCPGTVATGVAGCAYFNRPTGIAISKDGKTLYVADSFNHRIRSVNVATGQTKFLAGSSTAGIKNGVGSQARFKRPNSLVLSADGKTLYIADETAHTVSSLNVATKQVTRLMGTGVIGLRDGKWGQAVLAYPQTLAQGPGNTLLLTEVGSNTVRIIDLSKKTINLLAGSGKRGNANGAKKVATFNTPRGVVMLSSNTVLVADQLNDLIRAVGLK